MRSATVAWFARIVASSCCLATREVRLRRLEDEDADHALVVLERDVQPARHAVGGEVVAEDLKERALGVRCGLGAIGQVEALADARRPGGTRREILELRIVRIDRFGTGNGADVAGAALVQRDRAAVERQRLHRQVHDRPHDAIEVERRCDLAAHLHDEREVASAVVGGDLPGISPRDLGRAGKSLERLTFGAVYGPPRGGVTGDAKRADRLRMSSGTLEDREGFLAVERLRQIILGSPSPDELLGSVSDGDGADERAVVHLPQRYAVGAQEGRGRMEQLRLDLIGVERRREVQRGRKPCVDRRPRREWNAGSRGREDRRVYGCHVGPQHVAEGLRCGSA